MGYSIKGGDNYGDRVGTGTFLFFLRCFHLMLLEGNAIRGPIYGSLRQSRCLILLAALSHSHL